MALRDKTKHYRVEEIRRRHFSATARTCGLGRDMGSIIDDVVAKTPSVIDAVAASLPRGFPTELFECVTSGLRSAAAKIAKMPAT